MFLCVLMHYLILKLLLIHLKLLTITCDSRLARIDWSLNGGNHVEENGVVFGVSDIIKPLMLQRLLTRHPLSWIHFQQSTHQTQRLLRQTAQISLLERLWPSYIWEF